MSEVLILVQNANNLPAIKYFSLFHEKNQNVGKINLKMTQYNKIIQWNVNLSTSQLQKLNSATANGIGITLRQSLKTISDDEIYKSFLSWCKKTYDVKNNISKIVRWGYFLGKPPWPLPEINLLSTKSLFNYAPLAKILLIHLGLPAAPSAADAKWTNWKRFD